MTDTQDDCRKDWEKIAVDLGHDKNDPFDWCLFQFAWEAGRRSSRPSAAVVVSAIENYATSSEGLTKLSENIVFTKPICKQTDAQPNIDELVRGIMAMRPLNDGGGVLYSAGYGTAQATAIALIRKWANKEG